jgi:spermidine synthase
LFHEDLIMDMHATMRSAGFLKTKTFYFPQCLYPSGWWSGTMASKGDLEGFREAAAKDLPFEPRYYNTEVHKAAFATPTFMRRRLDAL